MPGWCLGPFARVADGKPVLSPQPDTTFDCPMRGRPVRWESDHVFNPAAVVRGGKVCLLYRAEDDSGSGIGMHTSRVGFAQSADGLRFTSRAHPVLFPDDDLQKRTEWTGGCEDPRIVETESGTFVLTYTQWDRKVARLAVATSSDLITWQKHGPAFAKELDGRFVNRWSKSGSIVTRLEGQRLIAARIDGAYWMYWGEGNMHMATSSDLLDWRIVLDDAGEPLTVAQPRPGMFDSYLVEPGPPAIITDHGIVLLYNGKNGKARPDPSLPLGIYTAGQCLFDALDPRRLVDRTDTWFLRPDQAHEVSGQYTAGTTFIEGLVRFNGKWLLYYGAADSFVGVAVCEKPRPS
ncbi:MAG: glycoside hydrolase family 130 protein [Tepidisphaeraceae bacterium]